MRSAFNRNELLYFYLFISFLLYRDGKQSVFLLVCQRIHFFLFPHDLLFVCLHRFSSNNFMSIFVSRHFPSLVLMCVFCLAHFLTSYIRNQTKAVKVRFIRFLLFFCWAAYSSLFSADSFRWTEQSFVLMKKFIVTKHNKKKYPTMILVSTWTWIAERRKKKKRRQNEPAQEV